VHPRLRVVFDKREPTAQLDGGRELAAPLKCGADCHGILIADGEHCQSMGSRTTTDKLAILRRHREPDTHRRERQILHP